jgi:hypothetical protein
MKRIAAAMIVAASLISPHSFHVVAAGETPGLAGRWTLDRAASEFPSEIGFTADWMTSPADTGDAASEGAGRQRGGAPGGGRARPPSFERESAEDGRRVQILTGEVRTPPEQITISETATTVTIGNGSGPSRTFHPGTKQEAVSLGDVSATTTAEWSAGSLVVVYDVEEKHQLRYTYWVTEAPRRLHVQVQFVQPGGGDSVVRIYQPAAAAEAPAGTAPAAPTGARPPAQQAGVPAAAAPASLERPGSELKGLTRVGVVVEGLGSQASSCGLDQTALETAVAKALTGVGLVVARNSDEDTYVYVNVMTAKVSTGLCVSRYDVSLLSHTAGTLSYQQRPALLEVSLIHKGGLAGSAVSSHAAEVVRGVADVAGEIANAIRDQNR